MALILCGAASPERQSAQAEQQQASKAVAESLETIANALTEANKPRIADASCSENEENRNSDLCAQWKAADAAAHSADWTMRGFWAGLCTLAAAVTAAAFAERAAHHTKRAANIADAETRPWVSVRVIPNIIRWNDNKTGVIFQNDYVFENIGRRAAVDFVFYVSWAFSGDGVDEAIENHRTGAITRRDEGGLQSLLPGEAFTWPGWSGLSVDTINWLGETTLAHRMMPVALVTVFYRDGRDNKWLTTERFYSIGLADDEGRRAGIKRSALPLASDALVVWPRGGTRTE